jgi:hypothetical protein
VGNSGIFTKWMLKNLGEGTAFDIQRDQDEMQGLCTIAVHRAPASRAGDEVCFGPLIEDKFGNSQRQLDRCVERFGA